MAHELTALPSLRIEKGEWRVESGEWNYGSLRSDFDTLSEGKARGGKGGLSAWNGKRSKERGFLKNYSSPRIVSRTASVLKNSHRARCCA